jgi:hypothetical protein
VLQVHRQQHPTLFLILWHARATEDAFLRWGASVAGANMVGAAHMTMLGHRALPRSSSTGRTGCSVLL